MTRRKLLTALMSAAFVFTGAGFAQKANVPKPQDKLALATENTKQLLLLMDTNKDGKISKKEWMDFMSAEFDRLDTDKNGYLDPKELLQSRVSVRHVRTSDQGK